MGRPPKSAEEYEVVDLGYSTPCHRWLRATAGGGYGTRRVGGVLKPAHVVAWEVEHGPVPEGMVLDHLCRMKICIRPDHLDPVTQGENVRRGGKAKLDDTVLMIRESSESARSIARKLGVSHNIVASARRGASWR